MTEAIRDGHRARDVVVTALYALTAMACPPRPPGSSRVSRLKLEAEPGRALGRSLVRNGLRPAGMAEQAT